jgi:hypothetical protein
MRGKFSNSETLFSHLFLFIVKIEKHCLVPKEQFGVFQMSTLSSCKAACFRCSLLYLTKMEQKSRRMKKTAGPSPG